MMINRVAASALSYFVQKQAHHSYLVATIIVHISRGSRGQVFVKFHYIKNCTISSWSYSDEHERQPNQRFTSSLERTQIGIGTHHKERASSKYQYQYQSGIGIGIGIGIFTVLMVDTNYEYQSWDW